MALTTTGAVKCFNPTARHPKYAAGHTAAITRTYRVNVSQTIKKGDPIIQSAGKASRAADAADLASTNLLGIAASDKTTTGTVTINDVIQVYDARANVFEASCFSSETVDYDFVDHSDLLTDGRALAMCDAAPYGTAAFPTFWGIDIDAGVTQDICQVLDLSSTQPFIDPATGVQLVKIGDKVPSSGAQTGILNPRVIFVFASALYGL